MVSPLFRVLVIVVGILTILPSYRFLKCQDAEPASIMRCFALLDRGSD